MAIFQRAGMRKGGSLYSIFGSYDKFGYDIFAGFKIAVGMTVFQLFYEMKLKTSEFKVLAF